MPGPGRAALFDVDGTLTRQPTLFSFRRHWLRTHDRDPRTYLSERDRLRELAEAGAGREELNRAYYTVWAGERADELVAAGASWFAVQRHAGGVFRAEALAALRRHRSNGDLLALISGSFPAVLQPIAELLGVDALICTQPVVRDGVLTGEVVAPMIGDEKVRAGLRLLAGLGVDPSRVTAYGDHPSDVPLLARVGTAVVVGDDPLLATIGGARGWTLLRPLPPLPPLGSVRAGRAAMRTAAT